MAGLRLNCHGRACPGHPRFGLCREDVDARDKRGHDGGEALRFRLGNKPDQKSQVNPPLNA
jgi:hypothetical protein